MLEILFVILLVIGAAAWVALACMIFPPRR